MIAKMYLIQPTALQQVGLITICALIALISLALSNRSHVGWILLRSKNPSTNMPPFGAS
jgi:hypothetical protein